MNRPKAPTPPPIFVYDAPALLRVLSFCVPTLSGRARLLQVGRRYKVTNPEKFRDFYGKMMYMLQDAQAQGRVDLVNDIKVGVGGLTAACSKGWSR